ncbi:MAG: glutamate decarboxylase [Firmicutes bacterium]|nr:glutamate decarboxylase [Bacillota bacterium]
MWTVIYIAHNRKKAEAIKEHLTDEGMLVKIQSVGKKIEKEYGCFEILVPESEAEEAQNILYEIEY